MGVKNCPNCGTELEDVALYCQNCGYLQKTTLGTAKAMAHVNAKNKIKNIQNKKSDSSSEELTKEDYDPNNEGWLNPEKPHQKYNIKRTAPEPTISPAKAIALIICIFIPIIGWIIIGLNLWAFNKEKEAWRQEQMLIKMDRIESKL